MSAWTTRASTLRAGTADVAEAFSIWRAERDHARALVAAAPSLETRGFRGSEWFSLRWVLTHMLPAAMVTGELDYPVVIRCAQDIATRIPGCEQITAPGADHLLPLRIPGQLAQLIDRLAGHV